MLYNLVTDYFTSIYLAGTCGNRTHPALLSQHHYGFEDRGSHQARIRSRLILLLLPVRLRRLRLALGPCCILSLKDLFVVRQFAFGELRILQRQVPAQGAQRLVAQVLDLQLEVFVIGRLDRGLVFVLADGKKTR